MARQKSRWVASSRSGNSKTCYNSCTGVVVVVRSVRLPLVCTHRAFPCRGSRTLASLHSETPPAPNQFGECLASGTPIMTPIVPRERGLLGHSSDVEALQSSHAPRSQSTAPGQKTTTTTVPQHRARGGGLRAITTRSGESASHRRYYSCILYQSCITCKQQQYVYITYYIYRKRLLTKMLLPVKSFNKK